MPSISITIPPHVVGPVQSIQDTKHSEKSRRFPMMKIMRLWTKEERKVIARVIVEDHKVHWADPQPAGENVAAKEKETAENRH